MPKASVSSLEALEILDLSLGRFAEKTAASLEAASSVAERGIDQLENRRRYWAREVDDRQREYDSADPEEDDLSTLAYRVQEAEGQLANVEQWRNRVDECVQSYSRQQSQVDELVSSRLLEARSFLRRKIETLREWASAAPTDAGYSAAVESASGVSYASGTATNRAVTGFASAAMPLAHSTVNLSDAPLPAGFSWVNLDDISPEAMGRLPEEFRKVDYAEMRRGFDVLKNEILPLVNESPQNANADYLWRQDRENGLDESNGSQRVFNAFFGKDPIHLERGKCERYYGITNGQHRIRVARDLGWRAVPAEAKEAG